jgi:multidrug resistance protein MdtO
MIALASAKGREWPFVAFLREELAPRSGRLGAVARITTCCTIVVATAMLYRIPEPAYAAYIVFFLGRGDTAVTLRTGMAGGIAVTLATLLSLILYSLDAGEPALRLPLMAVSTFLGMFLMRTMTMGPIAFLSGFILVVTQSIIDVIPDLEALTRFVLWLWVVVLLPDVVTVLVNMLTGPNAARLARQSALQLMATLADALRRGATPGIAHESFKALELADLRERAGFLDPGLRPRAAHDASLIEIIEELISLTTLLPPDVALDIRLGLAEACDACREILLRGAEPPFSPPSPLAEPDLVGLTPDARPVVVAMRHALDRLAKGLSDRRGAQPETAESRERAIFVRDAFSNPEHTRFALKTTAAAMAAYIIYTGADWPGIRTALITCFFVALGTLGETLHKLTLRVSGAAIGGLIGGLCIVYVLPMMTDIGDLILLIAVASAAFAWVATSSERLAYAGMQMALAFNLGVLQDYSPATDLTVLRDRMAGMLLGNILMSVAFSVMSPVSAAAQAREGLAAAWRTLAALSLDHGSPPDAGRRLAVARAIARARHLMSLGMFETGLLAAHPARQVMGPASFEYFHRVAGAVFVVAEQFANEAASDILHAQDAAIAAWFSACAESLSAGRPLPPSPSPQALGEALAALPADAPIEMRSALEARLMLLSEIEGAGAHAVP